MGNRAKYKIYTGGVKSRKNEDYNNYDKYWVKMFIDGKELDEPFIENTRNFSGNSYGEFSSEVIFVLNPPRHIRKGKENFYHARTSHWSKIVNNLPKGDHTVKLELWVGDYQYKSFHPQPVSSGEFILSKSSDLQIYSGYMPEDIRNEFKDKEIEAAIIEAMPQCAHFQSKSNNEKKKVSGTPIKVYVQRRNWNIVRNEYSGQITGRANEGWVVIKDSKGDCNITNVTFNQPYVGNEFNGAISIISWYESHYFDCDLISPENKNGMQSQEKAPKSSQGK